VLAVTGSATLARRQRIVKTEDNKMRITALILTLAIVTGLSLVGRSILDPKTSARVGANVVTLPFDPAALTY
jgi:hypothetical protein